MRVLLFAVPLGGLVTLALKYMADRLSSDAMAMAIGLAFGVLSLVPTALLLLLADRRRYDSPDEPPTIDVYPTAAAEDVTPYTHLFRRAAGMPALPDRQAEIAELEAYRCSPGNTLK